MAFLPLLDAGNKKRNLPQDSQVLVTSSVAAYSRYLNHGFAYSTSKAAVTHLVKMMATTFAQQGFRIRANLVAPGLYPSEMTASTTAQLDRYKGAEGHEQAFVDSHVMEKEKSPAERTGSEEDFAGTFLFMASRAGAYLNGNQLLTVCFYYFDVEILLMRNCVGWWKDECSACDLLAMSIKSQDIDSSRQHDHVRDRTVIDPKGLSLIRSPSKQNFGQVTRGLMATRLAVEEVYVYLVKYRLQIYRV